MRTDFAERARALIGCAFRPQGRDPATGLDCLGLIASAFQLPPSDVPRDYRLRGDHLAEIKTGLSEHFRRVARTKVAPGDVLIYAVAADQAHLGIKTDAGFVHAHAGLGRVVETPGTPPWPLAAAFRRRTRRRQER